jgi:predicted RNA-binding Zn ribbon-like protein
MASQAAGYDPHPGYPDNRSLTPAALRPVQAFVNTIDREHGVEGLTTPERLRQLLADFELADPRITIGAAELEAALAVREALFRLFVARAGGDPGGASMRTLEQAARDGRVEVRISEHEPQLVATAPGLAGALAQMIVAVQTAAADGSLRRLKACRRSCCHWLFWDGSPPASGVWCSMSVCGNRTKVRRHRAKAARS